jgi:hypothetical protein
MSEPKKPLSETGIGRMMDERIKALAEAQAKRDAEQDAKLARPSVAVRAVAAGEKVDFTQRWPIPSALAGLTLIGVSLWQLDGVKLYIGAGIGVCLIPGLVMYVVRLATGLKKAKGE